MKPFDRRRSAAQDLSKASAFRLGPLAVDPTLRRLSTGAEALVIQPRVMRVLVALAEVEGAVLSRDDLIDRCWDGTIVGDNAINRVISQLRRALETLTGEAVRLETITKVGFRLVWEEGAPAEAAPALTPGAEPGAVPALAVPPPPAFASPPPPAGLSRRRLALGAGALGLLAAAGGWALLGKRPHRADPQAVALSDKAELLLKSGLPGSVMQAKKMLEDAVRIDPGYATAWGRLAGIYRHALQNFGEGEKRSYPALVRSAATRALALDPSQPDARLALALLTPWRGNWAAAEAALTEIQREFPNHWYANGQLSLLLLDVGRPAAALEFRRRLIAADPEIPHGWAFLALNLLLAGLIQDADAALDEAARKWPRHPFLWSVRRTVLLETERPLEAAAFARDVRYQPEGIPPSVLSRLEAEAEAAASDDPALRRRTAEGMVASVEVPVQFGTLVPLLALLGADDLALGALAAYLFGGAFAGRDWPAPLPHEHRQTALLFFPSLRPLAGEAAYAALTERTGLAAYWKTPGHAPERLG